MEATFSSWVLLREFTKLTNWGLPKLNITTWFFNSCRLHLQLTTMSDNLDFIKFHLVLNIWAIYGSRKTIVWSLYDFRLSIVWAIHDCRLTTIWSIYDFGLVIVWSIYDNRLTIVRTIYEFRLTIVWVITCVWLHKLTINDFQADHSKIIYEIL